METHSGRGVRACGGGSEIKEAHRGVGLEEKHNTFRGVAAYRQRLGACAERPEAHPLRRRCQAGLAWRSPLHALERSLDLLLLRSRKKSELRPLRPQSERATPAAEREDEGALCAVGAWRHHLPHAGGVSGATRLRRHGGRRQLLPLRPHARHLVLRRHTRLLGLLRRRRLTSGTH